MDPLPMPLDYTAIERILPHRYPFLLVDRVTEFEPDKRIVCVKNVSFNERTLAQTAEGPVMPPTILTEAVAQVGAIMILSKPENREKLIFFMGIERVRYRRPVRPGDVVVEQPPAVLGEAGGVERWLVHVHVEKPLEQQVVAELLAEHPFAADRVQGHQHGCLQ